ncbi:MAG: ribonuclease Z [Acidimicrobiales bacterium]
MTRALTILGTAAQSPTATRNQNGYLLRWDDEAILFDPGEGTQRQMLLARTSAASLTRICITHFHGDHCLGLPGVVQRRSLDPNPSPLDLHYPARGHRHIEALLAATVWDTDMLEVRLHPMSDGDSIALDEHSRLDAKALDHTTDTLGWRIEEGPRRHLQVEKITDLGIEGPAIGKLQKQGWYEQHGRRIDIEEVSVVTPGQRFALVMDTRRCAAASELAEGADLLVIEATYLESEAALAAPHGHLTAREAAEIGRGAIARRTVLSHFSDRYTELTAYAEQTRDILEDCIVGIDLTVVAVPRRRDAD